MNGQTIYQSGVAAILSGDSGTLCREFGEFWLDVQYSAVTAEAVTGIRAIAVYGELGDVDDDGDDGDRASFDRGIGRDDGAQADDRSVADRLGGIDACRIAQYGVRDDSCMPCAAGDIDCRISGDCDRLYQ